MAAGMKMKELEAATGVGRETIRFYIREGLLPEPSRPGRNVAWYDPSFVERIHLIRELQQKRFLPLSVIKAILAGDRDPDAAESEVLRGLDERLEAEVGGTGPGPERLSSLARRVGLPVRELRQMEKAGALSVGVVAGDQWVDAAGVAVVEAWAAMREAGFTKELGFQPSDLAIYADMVRWLVREELRLFAGKVAGRVDEATSADMARKGIELMGRLVVALREGTMRRTIAEGNPTEAARAGAAVSRRAASED
jgi:DNA-binding transcriptional MerR regulator